MIDGEIGLGSILQGQNALTYEFGKVTGIERSKGTYKGWLYKINGFYFRADELSHCWWRELKCLVGDGNTYKFNKRPYIKYKGVKVFVDSVVIGNNWQVILYNNVEKIYVPVELTLLNNRTCKILVEQYRRENP